MKGGSLIIPFLVILLLVAGCLPTSKIRSYSELDPKQEREALYIVPFDATLVPPDFGEPLFDQFVDFLNAQRKKTRVGRFVILKEELKDVEPVWLIKQNYISGDIWGYVESSGCCSTSLKVKSRAYLYEPGKGQPTMEVFVPAEFFFEHDRVSLSTARASMGTRLARELADAIIRKLTPP